MSFGFYLKGDSPVVLNWIHLSSDEGDIPTPLGGREQTSSLVFDLNNDGLNDFVIGNRSESPSVVWYQQTAFGWTQHVIESELLALEAGGDFFDIDSDGDLDFVLGGNFQSNAVWWWENPYPNYNQGTSWNRRLIKNSGSNKHHDQLFGDFDSDGSAELIFWNQSGRNLFMAEIPDAPHNTEPWEMTAIYTWSGGSQHEGLAKADIDGDGILDIVGGGRWFKYNDSTNFTPNLIDDAQRYSRAAVGQLIEGGRPEVVFVAGDHVGPLEMFEWDGATWVSKDLLGFDVDHGHSLQIADVNRDGFLDIFCAEMRLNGGNEDSKIWLFLGDGAGNFRISEVATGFGNHESRLADLNGDGKLDILGKPFNWETPRLDIWLQDNTVSLNSWERHVIDDSRPWRAIFITADDVDSDGLSDIITGGWWYRNPGQNSANWQRNTIGDSLHNMAVVYDFDGDADKDILGTAGVGSQDNSSFVWAKNSGFGEFEILPNIEAGEGDFLQGIEVGNFQGTDNLQISLSWHSSSTGVQMLTVPSQLSDELWSWQRISSFSQGEALSSGDIDRDGDTDILMGTEWLQNDAVVLDDWWDLNRSFRLPIRIYAADSDISQTTVAVDVNFTTVLSELGKSVAVDTNSLHMVEVTTDGNLINEQVVFEFEKAPGFDDSTNAQGVLRFMVEGTTQANSNRTFIVYFNEKKGFDFSENSAGQAEFDENSFSQDSSLAVTLCAPEEKTYSNGSPAWAQNTLFATEDAPDRNKLVDMNLDGRMDVVVGYEAISAPGKLAWYEQPLIATESWTEHVIDTIIGPMSLDVNDMDNDGDMDVVVGEHNISDRASASLYIYENTDGFGEDWVQHLVYTGDEHHTGAQIVDIDRDGDYDIVSIGWIANDVLLYENTSTGTPSLETVATPSLIPGSGSYIDSVEVRMSTATANAEIRYTLDGTTPNPASFLYQSPLLLTSTNTVKARAFKEGFLASDIVTQTYFISSGETPERITNGLKALYEFDEGEGSIVNDVSGVGSPLNLTIDNLSAIAWGNGNISINSPTIIKSSGPATKLIDACKVSNEITIEGWIKPANLTQNGPARIVTLSSDAENRNFTIGQDGSDYDCRLRTTTTGNNGSNPSLESSGTITANLTHFVYTRSANGNAKFYVNATEVANSTISGNLSNWSENFIFALGDEISGNRDWLGELYLFAIFDRALSDEEIIQNYFAGFGADGPVPVELIDFSATVTGNDVTLNWQTASETNNYGFGLERQSGGNVIQVGFVRGQGTTIKMSSYTFVDKQVPAGIYEYHLKQIDLDGSFECMPPLSVNIIAPKKFTLGQNYPNPFNPSTTLEFEIPEPGKVELVIYNIRGELIENLIDEKLPNGRHRFTWNATGLASGVYFYNISYKPSNNVKIHRTETKKLLFLQ